MDIKVTLLDGQKLEAAFEGFKVVADQPENNGGTNTAPGPFDYFLASTALCAGYFIKAYCQARNLPTDGINLQQISSKDPDNKYKLTLNLKITVPATFSDKDKAGIIRAVEGCSVKKTIAEKPEFMIEVDSLV